MKNKYNAFLSHNSQDKPVVEQIAQWLEDKAHLSVWPDKWNLIPGDPWQEEIEKALDESQCCVVFLGPNGIGPWQNEEMRTAICFSLPSLPSTLSICIFEATIPLQHYEIFPIDAREQECGNAGTQ